MIKNFYEQFFPFWNKLSEEDKKYLCDNSSVEYFDKKQPVHNGLFPIKQTEK